MIRLAVSRDEVLVLIEVVLEQLFLAELYFNNLAHLGRVTVLVLEELVEHLQRLRVKRDYKISIKEYQAEALRHVFSKINLMDYLKKDPYKYQILYNYQTKYLKYQ